ncbi:TRAFAC clade GTPase domain-containing protein [Pelosinus propionicus]|uniref:Double-GTPase 2 domain-containing protein n=1 Tax=Pelosinus propionicus DSM 13327 TaxID=1123291 RepID=A0A1I4P8I3_9FIRM|nr:hypothetical protein [Pelosinus propionicus]SFM24019.1 hypothetical protein SAMN04490355_105924 [Pelosinus propionicus DSM 13327]
MDNNDDLELEENDKVIDIDQIKDENVKDVIYELPFGNALTLKETYSITSVEDTRFIVVAGPSASGKTTLVTTFYQLFQKGPVGSYYFAGSQTLLGFEQRAYYTRSSSKLSNPETPKTRRGISDSILHLKLLDSEKNKLHNFLLSDFSGEDYSSAVANVEIMREDFGVIKRADVIVVIIDGYRISNKKYRHSTIQKAIEMLQTMSAADVLSKSVIVEIVISKYDLIETKSAEDPNILEYVNEIEAKILGKVAKLPNNAIKFFKVAAMPQDATCCELGYGLLELLQSWTDVREILHMPEQVKLTSEFNKFQKRMLGATL